MFRSHVRPQAVMALLASSLLLGACSDGSDGPSGLQPSFSFAAVDESFQAFLDTSVFDGISYTLVDRELGTVHEGALGDHTLDIVVQLASTSKVPSVTLLMALNDDESLDFDVEASIDRYLPWQGVYGDRTTVQLVSNTSGIPGLSGLADYGPHGCQFSGALPLLTCAELLYTVEVPGTIAPGQEFNYGGSQWQLSGAVAESVTNSTWNQLFDEYIGQPCELEVFTYGNMWSTGFAEWNGSPDSLTGQQNAHVEGGAISNMQDYAKLLLLHLRNGRCGDKQVLSPESVAFMQQDRTGALGDTNYGMGWWIMPAEGDNTEVLYDPGAFGAISWLDVERGIGGYVGIDDLSRQDPGAVYAHVLEVIIPLQQQIVDDARAAVGQ